MTTTRKLGKMEKRAKAACEEIVARGYGNIRVEWCKSNTWGNCPRIMYHGEKAAHAGGCGYDKLSSVLAEYLQFLPGLDCSSSGCGVSTVQEKCKLAGWELKHDFTAKMEDGFSLTKI